MSNYNFYFYGVKNNSLYSLYYEPLGGNKLNKLNKAIKEGTQEALQRIDSLSKWCWLQDRDSQGYAPLHYACMRKNTEISSLPNSIVKCLINNGADVNQLDRKGNSPLHYAFINEDKILIETLINKGADIHRLDEKGNSCLYYACQIGDSKLVEDLLKRGAVPSEEAYLAACEGGHIHLVRMFNNKLCGNNGPTPKIDNDFFQAIELNKDKNVIQAYLEAGANVNGKRMDNFSPLHRAIVVSKDEEVISLLIKFGADINKAIDYTELRPIDLAVIENKIGFLKILIREGANINAFGSNGLAPLNRALSLRELEIAELLLKAGADTNSKDHEGNTPLHCVAANGWLPLAELFLEGKTDFNDTNFCKQTPLFLSVTYSRLELAEFLLKNGADVNKPDSEGYTPLLMAILRGNLKMINLLLKNGADVNKPNHELKPLGFATKVCNCSQAVIDLLLENGAEN